MIASISSGQQEFAGGGTQWLSPKSTQTWSSPRKLRPSGPHVLSQKCPRCLPKTSVVVPVVVVGLVQVPLRVPVRVLVLAKAALVGTVVDRQQRREYRGCPE